MQNGRFLLDLCLYHPFKRYLYCSELFLEFSNCSLSHAIRLRIVSGRILEYDIYFCDLLRSLGHRHKGWLSIGLQADVFQTPGLHVANELLYHPGISWSFGHARIGQGRA